MTINDVPARYQPLYRQAMGGKSRKAAIRCFCLECVGWNEAEARLCTAPTCPLYPYLRRGVEPLESTQTVGTASNTGSTRNRGCETVLAGGDG